MNRYLIALLLILSLNTLKVLGQSTDDTLYTIGKQAFCGIIFYVKQIDSITNIKKDSTGRVTDSTLSIWKHGLVCAMQDQSDGIPWVINSIKNTGATTDGLFDKPNADMIVTIQGTTTSYAATICKNLNPDSCCNGDSNLICGDWYLPSRVELDSIYTNLVKNKIGNFKGLAYWSSVEDTIRHNSQGIHNSAYVVDFVNRGFGDDGQTHENEKTTPNKVRAVREFWVRIQ